MRKTSRKKAKRKTAFQLTDDGEVGRDLLLAGLVGELRAVVALVVHGELLEAELVDARLLADGDVALGGVDGRAVLGPLAHGLGVAVARDGELEAVALGGLHVLEVVADGLG